MCYFAGLKWKYGKKIKKAVNGINDLLSTMKGRKGKSEFCLIGFPGGDNVYAKVICPFTSRINDIEAYLKSLKVGGNTPTYYAIKMATSFFETEVESIRGIG
jgi:hypothetical protein